MSGMITEEEINRMKWASRRGMLELDLVLEPFVTARYANLDEHGRECFRKLMECEDQELFAWFMRREVPEDEELAAMVGRVLDYARTPPGDR